VVDMGIIPQLDAAGLKGAERLVVDKVGNGTANFTKGPAMSRQAAEKVLQVGFEQAAGRIENGAEILGTGDMGIGNTTPSAAIGAVISGAALEEMVGRGTGVDDAGLARKRDIVRRGIEANMPRSEDALDVLAKVGGFEIGGIAGAILAGAFHRRAVVLDGFISTAGALIAHALCPTVKDYLFAGHCSEEAGHRIMLKHLGLKPILDLGMRLGEGTGAALAMGVMDCAVRAFKEVLTFEEAGVANK
jgi:nicotinate-nucleotide--dimethylbenzimidazole phosphoribosyltransferase